MSANVKLMVKVPFESQMWLWNSSLTLKRITIFTKACQTKRE